VETDSSLFIFMYILIKKLMSAVRKKIQLILKSNIIFLVNLKIWKY